MKRKNSFKRSAVLASVLTGVIAVSGCDNDDETAQLRVIHASPDAPAVNVKLNSRVRISDLDYARSSGFLEIDSGSQDVAVEAIIPGGNADVITVPGFEFGENGRYTIMAVDNTSVIQALVVDESAAVPAADEVAIAVLHASPAATTVDVYVTGADDSIDSINPTFTFDFKDQVDAGALPAGVYRIRVTAPTTKTVVFDSGPVDLAGFAGQKLLISAISTTNSTTQAASPIKLLVATDESALTLFDTATTTAARVVHLSPDAGTAAGGPVEVWASSSALPASPAELIDAFSYTDIVPAADSYVGVPAGDYVFDVAPNGSGIGGSVYTSPSLSLGQGEEYTVVAAGYVLTSPAFGLLATGDDNRSIVTQASVKVVHAAPAAGVVDVYVTPAGAFTTEDVANGLAGDPLLSDFAFGAITEYVAVPPDSYDIWVVAGGAVAIDANNVQLAAGSVTTVIAREPIDSGLPDDFNVIVLTN